MLTIVLLPGMDGTGQLFKPFAEALKGKLEVRVVQYPTAGALGYEELEAVARSQLPPEGNFVILGESFSGPIAISLAATQPPGLVGLVLCSSFARTPLPALKVLSPFAKALPVKQVPLAMVSYVLLGGFATPALRSALRSALAQVSASAFRERVKAVLSIDVTAKLKAVKVPLLYLLASQDRVVPKSAAKHITQVFPSTRVVTIEAPHFLLQVAPAAAASAIGTFAHAVQNAV
jgi:pimeloyl-ACP methyl ester carboxylesterase